MSFVPDCPPLVFDPLCLVQAQGLEQYEVALGYIQQAKELLHILEAEVYMFCVHDVKLLRAVRFCLMKFADSVSLHVVLQFWSRDVPKRQPRAKCYMAKVS